MLGLGFLRMAPFLDARAMLGSLDLILGTNSGMG